LTTNVDRRKRLPGGGMSVLQEALQQQAHI
jgi:hypothetical protein